MLPPDKYDEIMALVKEAGSDAQSMAPQPRPATPPASTMATATERAPVGRQGPTMGRACLQILDGGGSQRHMAPLFDELRTGSSRS